ncbi:hypothetical protein FB107DRAFT_258914, partial [Schizophyllum commune]
MFEPQSARRPPRHASPPDRGFDASMRAHDPRARDDPDAPQHPSAQPHGTPALPANTDALMTYLCQLTISLRITTQHGRNMKAIIRLTFVQLLSDLPRLELSPLTRTLRLPSPHSRLPSPHSPRRLLLSTLPSPRHRPPP